MAATITDFLDVSERAIALGFRPPVGLAILPEYFESASQIADLRHRSEAATVKVLFRTNGLSLDEFLPASSTIPYIQNNNFDWICPTIFVSSALLSENPMAISVALSVLANYATDFFKGISGRKNIKLNIVVERRGKKSYKKIKYEGDVAGLAELSRIIQEASDE
jgi:hypothetical protein